MSAAAEDAKMRIMALIEEIRSRLDLLTGWPEMETIRRELDKMEQILEKRLK